MDALIQSLGWVLASNAGKVLSAVLVILFILWTAWAILYPLAKELQQALIEPRPFKWPVPARRIVTFILLVIVLLTLSTAVYTYRPVNVITTPPNAALEEKNRRPYKPIEPTPVEDQVAKDKAAAEEQNRKAKEQ